MIRALLDVFDYFVVGTTATYTQSSLNEMLTTDPRQAFQVVCSDIGGTSPTLTIIIEGSNDGRNWTERSGGLDAEPLSASQTVVLSFAEDGLSPNERFHRLKIQLGGTDPIAHVRISACLRSAVNCWTPAALVNRYGGIWLTSSYGLQLATPPDVQRWTPMATSSGLGTFNQSTASNRPHKSAVDGRGVVTFDGTATQSLLNDGSLADWKFMSIATGCTAFVMARYTGGSGVQQVFDSANSGNSSAVGLTMQFNLSTGQAAALVPNGTGTHMLYAYRQPVLVQDEFALMELRWSEAYGFNFRVDGGTPMTGAITGTPSTSDPTSVPRLGATSAGTVQFFTGDIKHVCVVPGVLTDDEATQARNFFLAH